jgi:hypothetical protein
MFYPPSTARSTQLYPPPKDNYLCCLSCCCTLGACSPLWYRNNKRLLARLSKEQQIASNNLHEMCDYLNEKFSQRFRVKFFMAPTMYMDFFTLTLIRFGLVIRKLQNYNGDSTGTDSSPPLQRQRELDHRSKNEHLILGPGMFRDATPLDEIRHKKSELNSDSSALGQLTSRENSRA